MYKTYIKKILKLVTSKMNYANGDIPYSWFIILNVIKMSSVPKLMYSVSAVYQNINRFFGMCMCVCQGGGCNHTCVSE